VLFVFAGCVVLYLLVAVLQVLLSGCVGVVDLAWLVVSGD